MADTTELSAQSKIPEKLSPSRAKTFMQCPRRFYYETILGLTTPETLATAKGTLAHHAFERIFDHPRGERSVETALSYVEPAWRMMLDPLVDRSTVEEGSHEWHVREANKAFRDLHPTGSKGERRHLDAAEGYRALFPATSEEMVESFLADVKESVTGWFSMENPNRFDPHDREVYMHARIAGVTVHGFIDRLDRVKTADGEIWYITDYKTGRPPKPEYADEAFFQLAVYALLVQATMGVTPHQLRLLYVREGRPDAVLTRNVSEAMLGTTRKKLASVSDGIKKAHRAGKWEARKNPLCGWCPFQPVCPAHVPDHEGLSVGEIAARTNTRAPAQ